jgi:probable phosphoglycerate mutase
VIIVRHGQSSYNTERRIQGRSDASILTQKGRSDAVMVGDALSHLNFAAYIPALSNEQNKQQK